VLLGLAIPLFVFLGTAAGLLCYGLAWGFGTPSVGVSIAAGFIAFVIVCLATPFGVGLAFMSLPSNEHHLIRTAVTLGAVLLGPIIFYQEVLIFSVPAGIAAGLMFYWYQPLLASILLAILSPLAGLVIGILLVGHAGDSAYGGDSAWGRGGLFYVGNDGNVDIGGDGGGGDGGADGGGDGGGE
jgi:hypothetical protein